MAAWVRWGRVVGSGLVGVWTGVFIGLPCWGVAGCSGNDTKELGCGFIVSSVIEARVESVIGSGLM